MSGPRPLLLRYAHTRRRRGAPGDGPGRARAAALPGAATLPGRQATAAAGEPRPWSRSRSSHLRSPPQSWLTSSRQQYGSARPAHTLQRSPAQRPQRVWALESSRAEFERRLYNRLTSIKLAIEILERKTELSDYQHKLARTAIESTDRLTADLLQERRRLLSAEQPPHPQQVRRFISWRPMATRSAMAGFAWGLLLRLGRRALIGLGRQFLRPQTVGIRAPGPRWTDLRLRPRRGKRLGRR